jgi:hypothetical protein
LDYTNGNINKIESKSPSQHITNTPKTKNVQSTKIRIVIDPRR